MALYPLVCNFENDFLVQLLAVDDGDTMDAVAEKAAFHTVGRRTWPHPPGTVLRVRESESAQPFDRSVTVRESGLPAMGSIVVYAE